jgi:hypothetical protein
MIDLHLVRKLFQFFFFFCKDAHNKVQVITKFISQLTFHENQCWKTLWNLSLRKYQLPQPWNIQIFLQPRPKRDVRFCQILVMRFKSTRGFMTYLIFFSLSFWNIKLANEDDEHSRTVQLLCHRCISCFHKPISIS